MGFVFPRSMADLLRSGKECVSVNGMCLSRGNVCTLWELCKVVFRVFRFVPIWRHPLTPVL